MAGRELEIIQLIILLINFKINSINGSAFVHLSIFWIHPRSPQFCLRDLSDYEEPVCQSHALRPKSSGGWFYRLQ